MKTVSLALALLTACGAAHDTDDQEGSPPPALGAPNGSPEGGATPSPYRIVEVPSGAAIGSSNAAKLVCSKRLVVGRQDGDGTARAIVFDYDTLAVTDLGNLGVSIAEARDGNAQGTYVGSSARGSGSGAFVYRDGVMSELPGIGGNSSLAYAINASGQIVGQAAIPGSGDVDQHAILWQPGCTVATDLGTLDGGYSFTRGINDAGVIVGNASDRENHGHVVIWGPDHVLVDLGTGGEDDAFGADINASGQIAGFTNNDPNGGNFHHRAVLIDDGQFHDLGSLGGNHTYAAALDDRGDVVGAGSRAGDQFLTAFLYSDGMMVSLDDLVDDPRWQLDSAVDICDNGVIAGNGRLDGVSRGFVLIPDE